MENLSKAQKARMAIRTFKILADSVSLQGHYQPFGKAGENLSEALKLFNPEIYGSMTNPRVVELKGLEYVIDRMPRGIERCNRIILTANEEFEGTSFEKVVPLKRRRLSYVVSDKEICFVITRGQTEVYDILAHITFLNIEAQKIQRQICNKEGGTCPEWHDLGRAASGELELSGEVLDQAIWNLSIILGRTYQETRESYHYIEDNRTRYHSNNSLFAIVYAMGERVIDEIKSIDQRLTVYFTPSLREMIGHHKYASNWAKGVKEAMYRQGMDKRPIHVISANMHSVKNVIYGAGALRAAGKKVPDNLYDMVEMIRKIKLDVDSYASEHGYYFHEDLSGSSIDVMLIDTAQIDTSALHPSVTIDSGFIEQEQSVIVVMDYAFGTQAFSIMDELLCPCHYDEHVVSFRFESVSIMGKAGILPGERGDIMLATAHVMEGTPHNYIVNNDLGVDDFDESVDVYVGPMVTVLGTSLQNRDVLERFHHSSWKAVGLEMEGGHYQRAINAAIIQGHILPNVKTRYAYYASDNPLRPDQTLAAGSMGREGIIPTYMVTRVLVEKILNPVPVSKCTYE
ncbi:MAG: hypothetical protein H8E79_01745 [Desulfobulbaceae bacterium]|uniref:Uncharacterized protein n=1 Tax=Candidatus Desulfatifera sulfidica TaxID=2841691 RepID=A0A8J6T8W0_9BACT|nr:hypothetical protein [Candidatus Desulfatifera sulfidica]